MPEVRTHLTKAFADISERLLTEDAKVASEHKRRKAVVEKTR